VCVREYHSKKSKTDRESVFYCKKADKEDDKNKYKTDYLRHLQITFKLALSFIIVNKICI